MAAPKKRVNVSDLKGLKLYNFLLKKLGEINAKSTKKQQLGSASKRNIVSKKLYPKYKNQQGRQLKDITADIRGIVRELPPSEICNPLYLSEAYLAFVEYYEIDNHIRTVLPDCLDVRVNAGSLGKTKIFNTRNYSYNGDGVRKIIENVRKEMEENASGMAYFNGVVKVKPKKKNDGTPENYFVDYVLYINDNPEGDDTGVDFQLPKKEEKKVEKVQDYLGSRLKELQKEKRKRKRQYLKNKPKTEKELKKITDTEIKKAIGSLKTLLKAGVISREQFEQQKAALLKLKKK